jgi:hypothetical protein
MPCYDERSTYDYGKKEGEAERKRLEERADTNARAACEALRLLEETFGEEVIEMKLSRAAYAWWSTHKEFDSKRKK